MESKTENVNKTDANASKIEIDTMEDKEDMFELEVDGKPEINSERLVQLAAVKHQLELPSALPSLSKQKKPPGKTPPPTPYGTPLIQTNLMVENMATRLEKI